jgi:hypothetical protein
MIEKLKKFSDNSFTAVVTVLPRSLDENVSKEIYRTIKSGGHVFGISSTEDYADNAIQLRCSDFEVRDKIDYYKEGDDIPQSLYDYLVTMLKMPEVNLVLDPFPELTGGKVKQACDNLGIECVELK